MAQAPMRFEGKVVVITGAGRGLGRVYAERFAERGAAVVVNDNGSAPDGVGPGSPEPAEEAAAAIVAAGGRAVADVNDVSTWEGASSLVERAAVEYGRIDVVVNNAGIAYTFEPFGETSPESFSRFLRVNLESSFLVTRAAWPHLIAAGGGRVLMSSSTSGYFGFAGQSPYIASKMGVVGLVRALAVEGRPHGINVNSIAPSGYTRLVQRVVDLSPNDRVGQWMSKMLDPHLVAPVVLWLAHDTCEVSGNDYDVAGGRVSRLLVTAETKGYLNRQLTPEDVRDHVDAIHDETDYVVIKEGRNHLGMLQGLLPVDGGGSPA